MLVYLRGAHPLKAREFDSDKGLSATNCVTKTTLYVARHAGARPAGVAHYGPFEAVERTLNAFGMARN